MIQYNKLGVLLCIVIVQQIPINFEGGGNRRGGGQGVGEAEPVNIVCKLRTKIHAHAHMQKRVDGQTLPWLYNNIITLCTRA